MNESMGLGNKIRNLFSRGVVSMVNSALKMQGLQLKPQKNETIDQAEHAEPYGFSSAVLPGAEAFIAFVQADRSHPVALVVADRRYRPTDLKPGEVCLYDMLKQRVHLTSQGMVFDGAGLPIRFINTPKITFDTPETESTGNATVAQNVTAGQEIIDMAGNGSGRTMSAMRATYDNHDHNDSLGGKTTKPNQKTSD